MPGRKPAPQFWAEFLGRPRPSGSYMTMKPGRSWFSVPRPYVTHEPTDGKPIRGRPLLIWNRAGAWLLVSVKQECTKAMSSTCRAMFGKISDTYDPDCP